MGGLEKHRPSKLTTVIAASIEGACEETSYEDNGRAFIATIYDEATADDPDGMFIRIQSWSEAPQPWHPLAALIEGRRVRVTVEVLD